MALQFVPPPPAVQSTYEESVLDFMGPHDPEVTQYHLPVGTLGLTELRNGATLDQVLDSGCRIVAVWPDGSSTSCEMTNPSLYGLARFRNFATGDLVATICARIAEAQGLDAAQARDYELHFLGVPGIYFEALHLVCQGPGSDLILPVASSHAELPTSAVLAAEDFLTAARAIASAREALSARSGLSS